MPQLDRPVSNKVLNVTIMLTNSDVMMTLQ